MTRETPGEIVRLSFREYMAFFGTVLGFLIAGAGWAISVKSDLAAIQATVNDQKQTLALFHDRLLSVERGSRAGSRQ